MLKRARGPSACSHSALRSASRLSFCRHFKEPMQTVVVSDAWPTIEQFLKILGGREYFLGRLPRELRVELELRVLYALAPSLFLKPQCIMRSKAELSHSSGLRLLTRKTARLIPSLHTLAIPEGTWTTPPEAEFSQAALKMISGGFVWTLETTERSTLHGRLCIYNDAYQLLASAHTNLRGRVGGSRARTLQSGRCLSLSGSYDRTTDRHQLWQYDSSTAQLRLIMAEERARVGFLQFEFLAVGNTYMATSLHVLSVTFHSIRNGGVAASEAHFVLEDSAPCKAVCFAREDNECEWAFVAYERSVKIVIVNLSKKEVSRIYEGYYSPASTTLHRRRVSEWWMILVDTREQLVCGLCCADLSATNAEFTVRWSISQAERLRAVSVCDTVLPCFVWKVTVSNGLVVQALPGVLHAYSLTTGELLWELSDSALCWRQATDEVEYENDVSVTMVDDVIQVTTDSPEARRWEIILQLRVHLLASSSVSSNCSE